MGTITIYLFLGCGCASVSETGKFPGIAVQIVTRGRDWLTRHDPGYAAARRALRGAILMPALFAFGDKVLKNPTMSFFLGFGAFAMIVAVDFNGSRLSRLRAQVSLGLVCMALICLGTLAGQSTASAVIATAIVSFLILFAGIVSSVLASATTALLLAFVLPVSLPGPVSEIPDRVAGWGISAAVSLIAITVLWPAATRNPIRGRAAEACRALAARMRAQVAFIRSDRGPEAEAVRQAAVTAAEAPMAALQKLFFATAYRPTGLSADARAVIRLVDELGWLNDIVALSHPQIPKLPDVAVCEVKLAAAEALEQSAASLADPRRPPAELRAAEAVLAQRLKALETAMTGVLPAAEPDAQPHDLVSSLEPSFRAQELSFIVAQIAQNVDFAAAAEERGWLERLLGRPPAGFTGPLSSAAERARTHISLSSSWLHNSLRGGAAIAAAVLVCDLLSVDHAFWVIFGTIAVLRTNAFSTGQNMLRAVCGTTLGFVLGGGIVYLVGSNATVLWVIFPFAVLLAGIAPAAISFIAGQAGFTTMLVLLFNLIAPVGWTIGIVRVEDVAIGGAVSLLVGLVFWPRGAVRALGDALSEAYGSSTRYLAAAVDYGLACCDATGAGGAAPRAAASEAAAAARRLDDTFRQYLSDRGSKPVPLAEMTSLVTGVAGVRIAADAVVDLWSGDGPREGDRAAARRELANAAARVSGWYDHFASGLTGAERVPDPLEPDGAADGRLVDAVAHDLRDREGHATGTGVRVIWTGDHLDAVRRLQERLVEPARAAGGQHAF